MLYSIVIITTSIFEKKLGCWKFSDDFPAVRHAAALELPKLFSKSKSNAEGGSAVFQNMSRAWKIHNYSI